MKFGVVTFLAVVLSVGVQGQGVIGTYAGGNRVFNGDGQPATSLFLSKVNFLALDSSGNPVLALQYRNVVVRVNPDGTLTRLAGTGDTGSSGDGLKAPSATLHGPEAVAYDSAGNLYIADTVNNKVRKIGLDGNISTIAGTGAGTFGGDGQQATQAQLFRPTALVVDFLNNIYICDEGNHRIRRITTDGKIGTYAGTGASSPFQNNQPATSVYLQDPTGLAVDSAGNLYIADFGAHRILKVAIQTGILSNFAGTGTPGVSSDGGVAALSPLRNPLGLAADSSGSVYISDSGNFRVRRVAPDGTITAIVGNGQPGFSGDGGSALAASLNAPVGLAMDAKSNLYIADRDNFRLRRVSASGQIATIAGNGTAYDNNVPAASLLLSTPGGVAIGSDGSLLISDTGADVLRRVRPDGMAFTIAGTGGHGQSGDGGLATSAELTDPIAAATDNLGNTYVVDNSFSVVRKIDSNGVITTVAGTGSAGFYNGDTIPATQAALYSPGGVAVDSSGNLYIADTGNNRIRRVTNGVITTVAGTGAASFGGDNGAATNATLNSPNGLAFDSSGNLYIADTGNSRIRKVTNGTIATLAGGGSAAGSTADGGSATAALLGAVFGVAADPAGNVYFSDISNSVVRKVQNGVISTVAGNYKAGFSGDGGSATAGSLNAPFGVAVTGGNVFIADFGNDRVRVVYSAPPSFQTSSSAISFNAASGGVPTSAQTLNLTTAVAGLPYSISISPAASWLTVTPVSGLMPAALSVIADPSQLQPNIYSANIVITSPLAAPPTQTVQVTFTVGAQQVPVLSLPTSQLLFAFAKTGSASSRTVQIGNSGGGTLSFGISTASTPWLKVSATSGTATPSQSFPLTVTADPTSLAPGTYVGAVALTFDNRISTGVANLAVTVTVSSTPQTMILSQSGLTFTAVQGGGVVPTQTFEVVNNGQGNMNWTLTPKTFGAGGNWLSVTPATGTSVGGTTPPAISVQANPAGLAPGIYYGQISVSSPTAVNSPQSATVVLNILSADQNPGPVVQPSGAIFTGVAGGANPAAQTILVSNLTPNAITMGSSRTFVGTGNWFVHDVINATIQPNSPLTITITPVIAGLLPGVYQGALSLAFSDGSLRTVALRLILAPSGGSTAGGSQAKPAACTPKTLVPLFTTLAGGFGVPAAWPEAVVVRVADDCGSPLTAGSVSTLFSNGDSQIGLTSLGDGRWSGTWAPVHNATGVVLTGSAQDLSAPPLTGTIAIMGGVQTNPDPPLVTPAGIISATNSSPGAPLAPGALISIYGAQLSDGAGGANQLPLENSLQGAQVMMAGRNLPLVYSSSNQINAIVPYDIPSNGSQVLLVMRDNHLSAPVQIPVADTLPAVFSKDQTGSGQGIIVDPNNNLVDSSNPTTTGKAIVIYCSGLGAVNGTVTAGTASPFPALTTVATVTVTIGGQQGNVFFSGLTSGYAGLYQVNVIIPPGITPGPAVPVIVTAGGRSSAPVTIAVQ